MIIGGRVKGGVSGCVEGSGQGSGGDGDGDGDGSGELGDGRAQHWQEGWAKPTPGEILPLIR